MSPDLVSLGPGVGQSRLDLIAIAERFEDLDPVPGHACPAHHRRHVAFQYRTPEVHPSVP
ncbi:hypothetical protein [Thermocatellispora tengchongensis]|uniref:hypothetical protein n=1 Tax=Thermocatellispora tengchongensis TaxID=1073253 RepID=UPI001615AE6E